MSLCLTLSPGNTTISGSPSPKHIRRLYPEPAELRPEEMYDDLQFPEPPSDRPYTVINMVSTADGRVTVNGRAGGIGGPVDRISMRLLRSRVDAVMVGAGTVRSEKINLGLPEDLRNLVQSQNPLGIVLSASGNVPLDNLVRNEDERILFLISGEAPDEAVQRLSERGEVRRCGIGMESAVRYGAELSLLSREYGIRRLLVEGGPSVNHALIESGHADELFLTFAPKLAGGQEPGEKVAANILSGSAFEEPSGMRLISIHESDGELYLRYSLTRDENV